jgi:hypothetical protein
VLTNNIAEVRLVSGTFLFRAPTHQASDEFLEGAAIKLNRHTRHDFSPHRYKFLTSHALLLSFLFSPLAHFHHFHFPTSFISPRLSCHLQHTSSHHFAFSPLHRHAFRIQSPRHLLPPHRPLAHAPLLALLSPRHHLFPPSLSTAFYPSIPPPSAIGMVRALLGLCGNESSHQLHTSHQTFDSSGARRGA